MALQASNLWQTAWKDECPPVPDASWKQNLANFIDARVTNKLSTSALFSAPGTGAMTFTFGKSAFLGALSDSKPASLASAVEAGILASTVVVAPGAFIGSDAPATKFSVVTVAIVAPASAALAKAKVLSVMGLPPTQNADQSQFPVILREAFLLLKISTTGLDSTPPPAGPLPLIDASGSVA